MKKFKILSIVISAVIGAAIIYFAYGVAKKRYFGAGSPDAQIQNGGTQNQGADQAGGGSGDGQSSGETEDIPAAKSGQPDINNIDCDKGCDVYGDNADNLNYCRQVCGQSRIVPRSSEEDCANLSGLEKDYCFRDLAVSKKDSSICKKISDAKLQSVCRNRVAEEILN